jgi:hypothetical protein
MTVLSVWKWELPTGEKVRAERDASGRESVYVGRRLVSRLEPGRTPGAHEVRTREAAEGAFRGGKSIRVVFDAEGCQLLVDGEPQVEVTPPPVTDWKKPAQTWAKAGYVAFFAIWSIFVVTSSLSKRRAAQEKAAIPPPPISEVHRSQDGLLTVHYPADFRVDDRRGHVSLEHTSSNVLIAFSTYRRPGTDIWAIEKEFQEVTEKSWDKDQFVTGTQKSNGSCNGHDAAIVVRQLSNYGEPMRQWSCTFFHEGHAFRFTLFIPHTHLADQPRLREILEAAEVR